MWSAEIHSYVINMWLSICTRCDHVIGFRLQSSFLFHMKAVITYVALISETHLRSSMSCVLSLYQSWEQYVGQLSQIAQSSLSDSLLNKYDNKHLFVMIHHWMNRKSIIIIIILIQLTILLIAIVSTGDKWWYSSWYNSIIIIYWIFN